MWFCKAFSCISPLYTWKNTEAPELGTWSCFFVESKKWLEASNLGYPNFAKLGPYLDMRRSSDQHLGFWPGKPGFQKRRAGETRSLESILPRQRFNKPQRREGVKKGMNEHRIHWCTDANRFLQIFLWKFSGLEVFAFFRLLMPVFGGTAAISCVRSYFFFRGSLHDEMLRMHLFEWIPNWIRANLRLCLLCLMVELISTESVITCHKKPHPWSWSISGMKLLRLWVSDFFSKMQLQKL